ncbi:hypothetical protein [Actinacidiphila paucisporea]|uniref:MFS transporter n=1 Tax=Actinacidiphila paucisporea TaxID=310782 RepID=A0A1M7HAW6_9ACTN|nr:hypothetical protein [Actinacidiphila paucisporea]SHM25634.1 hypothetical protein SAMN05216499_109216 [Actinacidiphila paucisporea]
MPRAASALRRYGSPVVVAALVDSLGSGAYLGVSVVVLTRFVGLPNLMVGGFLSAAGVVAFLLLVPLGLLAERIGARPMLVGLHAARALAYALLLLRPPEAVVLVLLCVITAGERSAIPMLQTLAGQLDAASRVATMARVRVTQNAGMSAGAGLAALALAVHSTNGLVTIVVGNIVSYLGAGTLLLRRPGVAADPAAARPAPARTRRFTLLHDRRFVTATALCAVLGLHAPVLTIGIPLWITTRTTLPSWVLPALVVGNTATVVLLQVRLSKGADRTRGAGRALGQSGALLAVAAVLLGCMAVVPGGAGLALLAVAVVAHAGAEMRQQAGAWGLSYALSPADRHARYLSFFSLGSVARNAVAPLLLTAVIAAPGAWGWLALALGLATASVLAVRLTTRWSGEERTMGAGPDAAGEANEYAGGRRTTAPSAGTGGGAGAPGTAG